LEKSQKDKTKKKKIARRERTDNPKKDAIEVYPI